MPTFIVPIHEHNDCHNPSGPGGGRFCAKPGTTATGEPIWRTPLKDYLRSKGEYPLPQNATSEEEDRWVESRQRTRQHEDQWMRGLKTAVATGVIDMATAEQLVGSKYALKPQTDRGIWEPLPPTLYHVTVNRDAVMQTGLQTKGERNTYQAPGLGGGDSEAISFTADKAYAGIIYDAFLGLHDVATGKTTAADLIARATSGEEGSRPFLNDFKTFVASSQGDFERWRDGEMLHSHILGIALAKIPPGSRPSGEGWMGRDERFHHGYFTPMTREERISANTQVFNAFLTARQEAGGPENPWFTFNDPKALAAIPREQIAVLEVTTKPGSMGWFQSKAEREWRVPTGQIAKTVTVLRTTGLKWGAKPKRSKK
jgi:hypothetical protein